ncbi:LOW QUALITY PROTEIN: hypothetical protein PHMEG_0008375 [Phytophthora megakarya]|uniref:Uncharacterized protein n=1 Tax=Phytophthora megakarya TaxID=4795 RepID=A0A225WK84_9STRA|nr:LOW QUALITY PROTEIN: hypothetical protein PHMEG_0008375 [Phytophthora megakarya]
MDRIGFVTVLPPLKKIKTTVPLSVKVVMEYEDVFRVDLGSDPPADIALLEIKLIEGDKPFPAGSRRYAPAQPTGIY